MHDSACRIGRALWTVGPTLDILYSVGEGRVQRPRDAPNRVWGHLRATQFAERPYGALDGPALDRGSGS